MHKWRTNLLIWFAKKFELFFFFLLYINCIGKCVFDVCDGNQFAKMMFFFFSVTTNGIFLKDMEELSNGYVCRADRVFIS